MRWIVCYDIPDDGKRALLARWLDGYGDRIQDSVFECELDGDLVERMWAGVLELVDPKEDKVGLLPMCGACVGRRAWVGPDEPRSKGDAVVWVV